MWKDMSSWDLYLSPCIFRAMLTTSLSLQTWSRTLWLLDTMATFGLPAQASTWVLPSANASRAEICGKILGREQSIAWKGFNFWRAYDPSWAPVTAFVVGEMWNRIREFSGSSQRVWPNHKISSEAGPFVSAASSLVLTDAFKNIFAQTIIIGKSYIS